MTSKIDLDYIMSKRTLSFIETSLLEYKKKILEDLSNYIDVSYETLEQEFLINETKKKYHGKDRSEIDINHCMARVWHKQLGPVQCSRFPFDREDDNCEFCRIHETKQNYGRIDEPFENLNI
jgi:hypothetical protein